MSEKTKFKPKTIEEIAKIERIKRQLSMLQQKIRNGEIDRYTANIQSTVTEQLIRDLYGKRNTFGDEVRVFDYALAYYGTPKTPKNQRQLLIASKGHIVNQGLLALCNLFGCFTITAASISTGVSSLPSGGFNYTNQNWLSKVQYMRVGTGTGTTSGATVALVAEDSTPATSQAGELSNPASNTYRVAWTATWNSGTLSAITVREIGLYLWLDTTLRTFGGLFDGTNARLFSRLSSSDGDFTAFTVNTSVPLTIEWRLTFTFA